MFLFFGLISLMFLTAWANDSWKFNAEVYIALTEDNSLLGRIIWPHAKPSRIRTHKEIYGYD